MPDKFLDLSKGDQKQALGVASTKSGRPSHLLEKDVWVVWALGALFASPYAGSLVFKGGTSLSKAYNAIQRFSEDVDVTYDIRALAPDLVKGAPDALPKNRSQQDKWSKEIKIQRLPAWIENDLLPFMHARLSGLPARAIADKGRLSIVIEYEALTAGTGYVAPRVLLEFGARSTGEPWSARDVSCDAAEHLSTLIFPACRPRVMRIERTFWEKATAMHVYCNKGRWSGQRFSRHWYDLSQLAGLAYANEALSRRDWAADVAQHKSCFFVEKDSGGKAIDYHAAVEGHLCLVPSGQALTYLQKDYQLMVADGLISGEAPAFDTIMSKCESLQRAANS